MSKYKLEGVSGAELLSKKEELGSWMAVAKFYDYHYIRFMVHKVRLVGYEPDDSLKMTWPELLAFKKEIGNWEDTAKTLNKAPSTLWRYKKLIELEGDTRADVKLDYKLNDSYLSSVQTESQAYWLGLMSGDGCIAGNRVSLGLATLDKNHVEKFKKAINCDKAIDDIIRTDPDTGKEYYCSILAFSSKTMAEDLNRHGVIENKSLIIKPSSLISDELVAHYIRGIFDADGSICYSMGINTKDWTISFYGSREVVQMIAEWIGKKIQYPKNARPHYSIFAVTYSGLALPQNVIRLIYDDATVYLDRKYAKIQEMLAQPRFRRDWSHLTESVLLEMKDWKTVSIELGMKDDSELDQIRARIGGTVAPVSHPDRSDITRKVLAEAIEKHGSKKAAAVALGITDSMMWRIYRDRFEITEKKNKIAANPEANERAKQLTATELINCFQKYFDWNKVAEKLSVHKAALNRLLKKHNIKTRVWFEAGQRKAEAIIV